MVVFRALGWGLLALAVGAVVHDLLTWWSDGAFHVLALGELWSRLDLGSLMAVQAHLQHSLSGVLWAGFLGPVLEVPALPAFVVAGLLCLWVGRRLGRRGAAEASFIGMSRPRRRRSRGLS